MRHAEKRNWDPRFSVWKTLSTTRALWKVAPSLGETGCRHRELQGCFRPPPVDTLTMETVPKLLQKCWGQMLSSNAAGLLFFSVTIGDLGYLDLVAEYSFKFMEYVTMIYACIQGQGPPKRKQPYIQAFRTLLT